MSEMFYSENLYLSLKGELSVFHSNYLLAPEVSHEISEATFKNKEIKKLLILKDETLLRAHAARYEKTRQISALSSGKCW